MKRVKIGHLVKLSLGTKDKANAKERYRSVDFEVQQFWQLLREGPKTLTQREVQALAGIAYQVFVEAFDAEPGSPDRWLKVLRDNANAFVGEGVIRIASKNERIAIAIERRFGAIVDGVLTKQVLQVDQPTRLKIIRATAGALDQAAEVNLRKADGDYRPDPEAGRFPEWKSEAKDRVSISGLFDLWRREHEQIGGAPSSVRRWNPVVQSFIEHVGHDDARRVTLLDAIGWKDKLMAAGEVTAATFKKSNRAALSTIFKVGVSRALLPDNPFSKLEAKAPKKRRERGKGFTNEEANAILSAALLAPTAVGKTPKRTRAALRWIPWLCAYSGARVNEIAQLHKRSVYEIEGVPCYVITPEDGTVKDGDLRFVPIHPHLIEQGFLEFVEKSDEGPLFYDPKTKNATPSEQASSRCALGCARSPASRTPGSLLIMLGGVPSRTSRALPAYLQCTKT